MKQKLLLILRIILIATPLFVYIFWISWYHRTFNPYTSDSGNKPSNYSALASLYGKSAICKNKESFLGQYALTCTDIYKFCDGPKPNINVTEFNIDETQTTKTKLKEDKTQSCIVYMKSTKPFRTLFIPSLIFSTLLPATSIFLIIKQRKKS